MYKHSITCIFAVFICLLAVVQMSTLQIVHRAQLQMSHRDLSRPLVQFRPDESPTSRKQYQKQSERCYLVFSDGNKKQCSLWVEDALPHDKNRCLFYKSPVKNKTTMLHMFCNDKMFAHMLYSDTRA